MQTTTLPMLLTAAAIFRPAEPDSSCPPPLHQSRGPARGRRPVLSTTINPGQTTWEQKDICPYKGLATPAGIEVDTHFEGGRPDARTHLGADLLGGMRRYGDHRQCAGHLEPASALRRRIAVGVLMLLGGAAFNAVNLAAGETYADFADQAHLAG